MSESNVPTILITGATDGIGLALANHYQATGARLVLVGRRSLDDLDDTLFAESTYCQANLSHPDCAEQVTSWLDDWQLERLDLVIHNAGVGYVGSLNEQSVENITQLVAVNLKAPVALTHHLLPRVETAAGKFAYISSVASVLPSPNYAVYSASKAALDGFVRNLQVELSAANSPASAHLIHPGATRTGMHEKSGVSLEEMDWSRFPSAEEVAIQIAEIIERGDRRRAVGMGNRVGLAAGRNFSNVIEGVWRQRTAGTPDDVEMGDDHKGAPHCVITGAADGIGRALALQYAASGYTITGIDLDRERAMRTQAEIINAGGRARFLIADLAAESNMSRIVAQLTQRPLIDTLIHNAGISAVGPFRTQPLKPQMAVLDVNFLAPMLLTAGLLQQKRLTGAATLILMASLSYYVGYPGAAVYAASKDGLVSYGRSLSIALKSAGIRILTVFPGPTRTAHARRYSPDNANEERRMSPDHLAIRIYQASQRGQRVLIPGLGNGLFAMAGSLAPGLSEQAMRKMIFDKMAID